jgi:ABC-2 type transport system permease protein
VNLISAELYRLVARRFVQLMAILLIGAFAVTGATTVASSHEPTTYEVEQAEERMRRDQFQREAAHQACLRSQDADFCDDFIRADMRIEDYLYGVFIFAQEIEPLVYFLIAFLALFAFLVAASFIGAELNSGGMTNLLLWRPRRMVVLGTKLGTLLATVLTVSIVASALYIGGFWAIAELRGFSGAVDGAFWADLIQLAVRGVALVLAFAVVGFSVATIGRHTAAAVGALATYAIVWEVGARIVLEVTEADRPDRWMLTSYVAGWVEGDVRFSDNQCLDSFDSCTYLITWPQAGAVFAVLLALLAGSAFATFRTRDLA